MKISLCYSPAMGAPLFECVLSLSEGATVLDALNAAQFYERYPQAQGLAMGIFSQPAELTTPLAEGDRVEIYRPLQRDPKQARLLRAASVKGRGC